MLEHVKTLFYLNIESIQHNAALAVMSAVRGTSREKLYEELSFESLQQGAGIENFFVYLK